MNIFAFNFGSLACDQITEMPNSDCIKWWQVKPKLVSAEMIGLRFILELWFNLRSSYSLQNVSIGVNLTVFWHLKFQKLNYKI
jgi:hypothetical protein